jgi:hypothetical protein
MLITLSRRTVICKSDAEVKLTGVVPLGAVSYRFIFYLLLSSLLDPNIRLRILFSNTFSLHVFLNVRYHVSQLYNTYGYIIVLYILIFKS